LYSLKPLLNKIQKDWHFFELLKGSGIAFFLKVSGMCLGYIFTLIVTRSFGASIWGIFALSIVVLHIASVLGKLGVDTALVKFTAEYVAKMDPVILKKIYQKSMIIVIPFSIFISILVFFLAPILAEQLFHNSFLIMPFRLISFFLVPFVILTIHSESIRGLKKIKEYLLLQRVGIPFLSIILFFIGFNIVKSWMLPLFSYGISILVLAVFSWFLWRHFLLNILNNFNKKKDVKINYSFILNVSFPLFLSNSLMLIMGWVDTIMLGMYCDATCVGVYNVAVKVAMIVSVSLTSINTILAPKFAEFWGKNDLMGFERIVKQSTKLIFWTSIPIIILILIFPKMILGFFGKGFEIGSIALLILVIGQLINVMVGSVGHILQMTGRQKVFQNVILIALVLNIILNYSLIPLYGINGAASASMISMIFWNLACWLYIKIIYGINTIYLPFWGKGKI